MLLYVVTQIKYHQSEIIEMRADTSDENSPTQVFPKTEASALIQGFLIEAQINPL